ncbi:MAG: hypothetical protein ACW99A_12110 [Candidatus Kariarchaeaceae archaeon]|jgi:hypothetical protein
MMGVPKEMAWAAHFAIGTLIHPFLLDTIDLGLGNYFSEIAYALVFAIMMIAMLGFLGAPTEWKPKMSMGIIAAHVVYAIVLALIGGL